MPPAVSLTIKVPLLLNANPNGVLPLDACETGAEATPSPLTVYVSILLVVFLLRLILCLEGLRIFGLEQLFH